MLAARILQRAFGVFRATACGFAVPRRFLRSILCLLQCLLRGFQGLTGFLQLPRRTLCLTCRPHGFELLAPRSLFGLT